MRRGWPSAGAKRATSRCLAASGRQGPSSLSLGTFDPNGLRTEPFLRRKWFNSEEVAILKRRRSDVMPSGAKPPLEERAERHGGQIDVVRVYLDEVGERDLLDR